MAGIQMHSAQKPEFEYKSGLCVLVGVSLPVCDSVENFCENERASAVFSQSEA